MTVESHWQKELTEAYKDPKKLLEAVKLSPADHEQDIKARRLFPMMVPTAFVSRMEKGNAEDPLLRQVMPLKQEFVEHSGFTTDPLLEHETKSSGLLHKYQSRVLLIVKGGCAVNCRYCFRRHFPYQDNAVNKSDWIEAFKYIAQDPNINEVIFSGGDPLMAKDTQLAWMCSEISKIAHVKTLRIHTRLPVVIPSRINAEFIHWFTGSRLRPVMVVHINHANEIDDSVKYKLLGLKDAGVTLLNQSVLLKGVNDCANALVQLHESLFDAGVLPYYLHLLDKVKGAGHFLVDDDTARDLMSQVIKRQPGYLVPKLVREISNQPGKTPVDLKLHP